MHMPGFTAENSLKTRRGQYLRVTATKLAHESDATPAQWVRQCKDWPPMLHVRLDE